jgi:23S rRNA (adenine2030-N6)-methyltransferase
MMLPVSAPRARYAADRPPDYSHRFHAGNVGDVWKHCALVEVLRLASARAPRLRYLDSHAGEGGYALAPTGEWTEGIGRLWGRYDDRPPDDPLRRYLSLCRRLGGGGGRPAEYPGSPAFAAATLGAAAELLLWERDAAAFAGLAARVGADPRVRLAQGDGLGVLAHAVFEAEAEAGAVVALVDPPYGEKGDWIEVPEAFAAAARGSGRACLVLWYPVKSLTRPNAMLARLEAGGVEGVAVEIVTTPLEQRRNRLNGSGLILVRPPRGSLESLAALAPVIGASCATVPGTWSVRIRSFRPSGRA